MFMLFILFLLFIYRSKLSPRDVLKMLNLKLKLYSSRFYTFLKLIDVTSNVVLTRSTSGLKDCKKKIVKKKSKKKNCTLSKNEISGIQTDEIFMPTVRIFW